MKKGITLFLTFLLVCGMSVTSYAGDVTISAIVPEHHTVTIEANNGRVIADNKLCSDTVRIERQKEQSYWIVPDKGKKLAALYYNGKDVTSQMNGSIFTAPPLTGDATLKAVFKDAPEASEYTEYDIVGTVVDEDGTPVPGITVDIGGNIGITDEEGNFLIEDVPPGTYPVVITDEEGNIIGIGEITIGIPEGDDLIVTEDENGSPVVMPGMGSTYINLTIVVNADGSIGLEDVEAYAREEHLDNTETIRNPQTGDAGSPWIWSAVMLLACGSLTGIVFCGKKKTHSN